MKIEQVDIDVNNIFEILSMDNIYMVRMREKKHKDLNYTYNKNPYGSSLDFTVLGSMKVKDFKEIIDQNKGYAFVKVTL